MPRPLAGYLPWISPTAATMAFTATCLPAALPTCWVISRAMRIASSMGYDTLMESHHPRLEPRSEMQGRWRSRRVRRRASLAGFLVGNDLESFQDCELDEDCLLQACDSNRSDAERTRGR